MDHAITLKDVLIVGGGIVGVIAIIGGIFWFLSSIDFSH